MSVAQIFFYLFSAIMIGSAVMVIVARNPVHSVLFLILAFVNAAGLFLLMGAEFLAMILIVVSVGAVAVLFLFVVMMLDVDFAELKQGFAKHLPLGIILGLVLFIELAMVIGTYLVSPDATLVTPTLDTSLSNTEALGRVLYTDYIYYFQTAGLVLLVAMVGAIVLTLHHRPNVKRQKIANQVARTKETAMEVRKVQPGQGL